MSEEWGPWIEHDGAGCPCVGMCIQAIYADGDAIERVCDGAPWWSAPHDQSYYAGPRFITSWDWSKPGASIPVLRYRIRKPRALLELIDMVEHLPETEDA